MTTQADRARALLDEHGQTFCEEVGIAVERNTPAVLWQLAELSLLLSSQINAQLAVNAARVLKRAYPTPAKTAAASEHELWTTLERGKYLRKGRTADQLSASARHVLDAYDGDLRKLRAAAAGDVGKADELLQELKGIGPVGAEIFLREVQVAWPELRPYAGARVLEAAPALKLPANAARLAELVRPDDVPRLMAAIVRTTLSQ